MNYLSKYIIKCSTKLKEIDWIFLSVLILMVNVGYDVKLFGAGILIIRTIYLLLKRPREQRFSFIRQHIPKFFLLIAIYTILSFFLSMNYTGDNLYKAIVATALWGVLFVFSIGAYLSIDKNYSKIKKTVTLFFILNILISFIEVGHIYLMNGGVNPYSILGVFSMSTGDWIFGITRNSSHFNSLINLFAIIFFLQNKKYIYAIMGLLIVLLINSNVTTLLLIAFLVFYALINNKTQKIIVLLFMGIIFTFFQKVSPENLYYIISIVDKNYFDKVHEKNLKAASDQQRDDYVRDSIIQHFRTESEVSLSIEEETPKIVEKNGESKSKNKSQNNSEGEAEKEKAFQKVLYDFDNVAMSVNRASEEKLLKHIMDNNTTINDYISLTYPEGITKEDTLAFEQYPMGKIVSFKQTLDFVASDPIVLLFGAGPGNFSSKLAFSTSGVLKRDLNLANNSQITQSFKENHLKLYCYFFSKDLGAHSITNIPFSSFNQVLGEYGVIGVFLFLIYYIFFYLKRFKLLTYGKYLVLIIIPVLLMDFMFEELTMILLFEILLLLDLKQSTKKQEND